jgi:hypothetical protein
MCELEVFEEVPFEQTMTQRHQQGFQSKRLRASLSEAVGVECFKSRNFETQPRDGQTMSLPRSWGGNGQWLEARNRVKCNYERYGPLRRLAYEGVWMFIEERIVQEEC